MPDKMNLLLVETDMSYEKMRQHEEVNQKFSEMEVDIVPNRMTW